MSADLCGCGCGESVSPGKRFVFGHYPRTQRVHSDPRKRTGCQCGCGELASAGKRFLRGHSTRLRRRPATPGTPCECGCGAITTPGKRFLQAHYVRTLRGAKGQPGSATCPQCGRSVQVRQNGTVGLHWVLAGKVGERQRCPAGGVAPIARRPRPRRRVSVTIDVSLPEGWNLPRFRSAATQAVRAIEGPFVVGVDVSEEAS